MKTLTDRAAFLVQAAKDPRSVGAVLPSGRALAAALAEPARSGGCVLEVGAGTGSVTRTILDLVPPGSRLDVIESNPDFAARVARRVATHPRGRSVRATVHRTLVEHFDPGHRYDVIVSGLPLTNFEPRQVHAIMEHLLALLRPGGTLTYFAYLGTGPARRLLASPAESRRHDAVERLMSSYRRSCVTGHQRVWANVPPARVWRLCGGGLPESGVDRLTAPDRSADPGRVVPA